MDAKKNALLYIQLAAYSLMVAYYLYKVRSSYIEFKMDSDEYAKFNLAKTLTNIK